MAQVSLERIEETIDPELTIDRALETYLKKGYSRKWSAFGHKKRGLPLESGGCAC